MALHEQEHYRKQAERAVANHAAEISTPIPHVSEFVEAAKIDIAAGEDPWEASYLGSDYIHKIGPEPKARRKLRPSGEISRSFTSDEKKATSTCAMSSRALPDSECLPEPELKKSVIDLARVWEKAKVQELDQIKNGLKIKEEHQNKRVGRSFANFVSSLVQTTFGTAED